MEATDQHRGWFQSSLLLGVATSGKAPYTTVMTHGFVVDKDRKKLSKSEAGKAGKPIDAAYFYNKYGADILRLWVSSVDWRNEVPFSEDIFQQVTDPYRRFRNTLRILLGNLHDFDPETGTVKFDLEENAFHLERWLLKRLNEVTYEVTKAYETFDFRKVFTVLNEFCAKEISAIYVDITKDRLYCEEGNSLSRRASQTAMYQVFDHLVRLLAPILSFTAEEAWQHAGRQGSVHEQEFPEITECSEHLSKNPTFIEDDKSKGVKIIIEEALEVRSGVYVKVQEQVKQKVFNKSNEASVSITFFGNSEGGFLFKDPDFSKEFLIVSEVKVDFKPERKTLKNSKTEETTWFEISVEKSPHPMCLRCRRYEPPVQEAGICRRCDEVIKNP